MAQLVLKQCFFLKLLLDGMALTTVLHPESLVLMHDQNAWLRFTPRYAANRTLSDIPEIL